MQGLQKLSKITTMACRAFEVHQQEMQGFRRSPAGDAGREGPSGREICSHMTCNFFRLKGSTFDELFVAFTQEYCVAQWTPHQSRCHAVLVNFFKTLFTVFALLPVHSVGNFVPAIPSHKPWPCGFSRIMHVSTAATVLKMAPNLPST